MKFLYAAVPAFAVGAFAMPAPQGENALMERSHPTTSSKKSTATSSTKKSTKTSTKAKTSSTKVAVVTATPTKVSSGSGSSGAGLPRSSGTSVLKAAQTIAAGGSFDGKMVAFDRGQSCTGQAEGGDKDAVFIIEAGGSLSNVIIGPNQIEGVHCMGACKLTNVWWSAVCEDAFTIKEQSASQKTTITGGGAFGAEDKVLQHNGGGTLQVAGFTVGDFGKLYRSYVYSIPSPDTTADSLIDAETASLCQLAMSSSATSLPRVESLLSASTPTRATPPR